MNHSLPARAACSSPAGAAGETVYNADYNMMQYCDGDDKWIRMSTGYVPPAVTFDGTNAYLRQNPIGAGASTDTDKLTMSFWVYVPSTATEDYDLVYEGQGANGRVQVAMNLDGAAGNGSREVFFTFRNSGNAVVTTIDSSAIADNQWHHVLFSFSAGSNLGHLYVDNALNEQNKTINPGNGNADFDADQTIGGNAGGARFRALWF